MGEYISREAVVLYLKRYSEKEWNPSSLYGMMTSSVLHKAERAMLELPAADVQPVKHGRWELTNNPSFRKCSECDAWWSSDITDNCFTNYCPKCGVRMIKDGEING